MKKKLLLAISLSICLMYNTAIANEIHYGSVVDVKTNEVSLRYKGPLGTEYFTCNTDTLSCKTHGETKPSLFPEIFGVDYYTNSPDGRFAISPITVKNNDIDIVYNILYTFNDNESKFVAVIPYYKKTSKIVFSPDGSTVVLFGTGGDIAAFRTDGSRFSTTTLSQSEFPFRSLSISGNYLAAYNYVEEVHIIWDVWTGKNIKIKSTKPGYVEFSQNDEDAVFIDDNQNFPTLQHINLKDFPNATTTSAVFDRPFTVEDFLFVGDQLYYMANEKNVYDWTISRYDFRTEKKTTVEENASYGDYLRRIDGKLAYLIVEGKNTNLSLYNPDNEQVDTIRAIEDSETHSELTRTPVQYGDVNCVLITPPGKYISNKPLFVWLHGGPIRQTSVEYHPYLSYAVYDEMLEKIAISGSYVLKLDYTGSYGYGSNFTDTLDNNIGIQDVADVINSVSELSKSKNISEVYLIGNSYGGYLSLRTLVEKPDMFAGAISINGVFDWFTLIERIKSSPFKKYFDGVPEVVDLEHNFDQYLKASIYSKISGLTNQQILLVFGENDSTVPVWQTKEMFYMLKGMEKNTSLLAFSDEDHIIRKRENLDNLCLFINDKLELNNQINCN